ncbi:secondary thiamine-phosphate synthase enzyme YjbQ [Gaiella sp.]|uniref:secondary thiamine-phosphate synthase enzyme YjbQ n=1 Tax=Gaiella sp. TaxID=2663207 RepID=UPI002E36C113|nr:secondary thiamine-phosphate synthase enzyme YjbQ [Gaiella sp.]HEX5582492.1 secondary thiamine-phosphate synthase enzyme YjbQ [Gaiella sp.]
MAPKVVRGRFVVKHRFENHDLQTEKTSQLVDVTDDVRAVVARAGVATGMALVYSPHTTCAVLINERESGFADDFAELLDQIIPAEDRYYRHDDLDIRTEGIEDDTADFPNGHSHCRAGLMASFSQTVPVVDGNLLLGKWQRIFFCELDRARPRKLFIQVIGE